LQAASEHLDAALAHDAGLLDLMAEELRLAQNALAEITGAFSSDDLLGEIFSRFCIGK
jgi:tRNA modification GTPase